MADFENPFSFGSPVDAAHFTDRREELEDIVGRMLNGQNVILLSPRRYGKTSLLYRASDEVRRRRGRTGFVTLAHCTDKREVAEALLGGVLNGPLSWLRTRSRELAEWMSRLRVRPEPVLQSDGSFRVTFSPSLHDESWADVIGEVLALLRNAADGSHPVSLVIDEFQKVAEGDIAGIGGVFKRMADELTAVSLTFSGSREHVMRDLTIGPAAPLLGMGEPFFLPIVPRDEMTSFLVERAGQAGRPRRMAASAADLVFDLVDGVPNDVQRLAYTAFTVGSGPIDDDVVRAAMARAVRHQAADFEYRVERLTSPRRRLLRLLARESTAQVYSRGFLDEVGVDQQNAIRVALRHLADADLVAQRGREWYVPNAFLRAWLRDDQPAEHA